MDGGVRVMEYIKGKLGAGRLHMTLLDPDKQSPDEAGTIAAAAEGLGTDAIMVGGSTGVSHESMDATIRAIKDS